MTFRITGLLDDATCLAWLVQYIHPNRFICPHFGGPDRWLFVPYQAFRDYSCRACEGYYTVLSITAFAKTRQRPATLVRMLPGLAKDAPSGP